MGLDRFLISAILGPELARWKASGQTPLFWWRDDDARWPSSSLDRLLSLSNRFAAPITLAAVPDGDIKALAKACRQARGAELAIHGFRHENRASAGLPSGEVHDDDRLADIVVEVSTALDVFRRAGLRPTLFVPPWNNAHATLKKALSLQGLGLSCYGQMRDEDETPPRLDTHLDVMRWKPQPRFRGAWRFLQRMRRLLVERRLKQLWDEPIGLLTHHLDHDEAAWLFLEALLAMVQVTARQTLIGQPAPRGVLGAVRSAHVALKAG